VRKIRSPRAIETELQERTICEFPNEVGDP